ncbi:MAG TPA: hypothetical protein DCF68_19400 [Cyanothece sp. UBA12306]|nr:hypothetical protein [Cyanothece sp. UBA12306]
MPTKFLESLGGKLAEKWLSTILTPAFLFWAGGLLSYIYKHGWNSLETWFNQLSQTVQIILIISLLLVVLLSAIFVQRCEFSILRFLEGYWPNWLKWLQRLLIKNQQHRKEKRENILNLTLEKIEYLSQEIAEIEQEINDKRTTLTPEEVTKKSQKITKLRGQKFNETEKFINLDWQLRYFPSDPMPTKLGNILKAAEQRPLKQYGLDTIICWPRLWLLLPDSVKLELSQARMSLNSSAINWFWSLLFFGWTFFTLWIIPIALLSTYLTYRSILNTAIIYGDLLESAFDLYRFELYQSLRFPLPKSTAEEKQRGEQLTTYLLKRPNIPPINFRNRDDVN